MDEMKKEVLRMEHVTVRYAGRNVLEDFHLNIYEGEFLFVYGFPDSGIRELGSVLRGSRAAQSGRFYVGGKEIPNSALSNPGSFGIYFVQNENNLVDDFTVAENLFFGGKKSFFGITVPKKRQMLMARRLLEQFGLETYLNPAQRAGGLHYFGQILLKLVMAYARGAKLVVVDGIVGLDVQEADNRLLERALRILLEDGVAVLWMNQRMDDARRMADRILVMQKGRNVRTVYKGYEAALDTLVFDLANQGGRFTDERYESSRITTREDGENKTTGTEPEVLFEQERLSSSRLLDLSLQIRKGEVVSICSLNSHLMQNWRNIVSGMEEVFWGGMRLEGKAYRPKSYTECMERGVCVLDLMWFERYSVPDMSIEDNMMMGMYWRQRGLHGLLRKSEREYARTLYRMGHPGWPADRWRSLSADQQKILLLERLCLEPHKLVIITEPFFQLHNTLLERFHELIRQIRDSNGAVVLMAAVDQDVRQISDRVLYLDQWARKGGAGIDD